METLYDGPPYPFHQEPAGDTTKEAQTIEVADKETQPPKAEKNIDASNAVVNVEQPPPKASTTENKVFET